MNGRQRRTRPKLAIFAAGAAALVATGVAGAGPATADQAQDDGYVAAVRQIFPNKTNLHPDVVLDNAQKVCGHLGRGDSFDTVVNDLREANHNKDSVEQVQQEVNLAKSTYCP